MHYIYGHHSVEEAIKNPRRKIQGLYCFRQHVDKYKRMLKENNKRDVAMSIVDRIDHLKGAIHQGVYIDIVLDRKKEINSQTKKILILDQLQDIRNIGAIIRSAAAFDFTQVVYIKSASVDLYDKANYSFLAKAASGACEYVDLIEVPNLARCIDKLKTEGFWIAGLDERGKDIKTSLSGIEKIALIIGTEGAGLRKLTKDKCDFLCKLGTSTQFPCLNASVAASVAMYSLFSE